MRLYPESDDNPLKTARESALASVPPYPVPRQSSDWIISCKLFFPLQRRYWEESRIPKAIVTDTALQGVYGYALELENLRLRSPGVLHLSYVWENDARDAIAIGNDGDFAQKCLQELDELLLRSENIREPISPFVDVNQPPAIHWVRKPSTPAYAKLYREVTWNSSFTFRSRPLATPSSPLVL